MAEETDRLDPERFRKAFAALPKRHRQIILLARVERLTCPEMGIRLGVISCEVEARLAIALVALDRAIERQDRPWWRFW